VLVRYVWQSIYMLSGFFDVQPLLLLLFYQSLYTVMPPCHRHSWQVIIISVPAKLCGAGVVYASRCLSVSFESII